MDASHEQIEAIKRARRLFSEDRTQHELSSGTCFALLVMQLMELTDAVQRIATHMESAGPGGTSCQN